MPRPVPTAAAGLAAALATLVLGAGSAAAAPVQRGTVTPVDLDGVRAERRVRDVVHAPAARAAQAPAREEIFRDAEGRAIRIGTSIADIDLTPVAAVLAGTIHGDELEALRVRVVRTAEVGPACGGDDTVVACYAPDDEQRLASGEMTVALDDTDLRHTVVHEYGHHMDNQLWNLTPLGLCGLSNDGSRRWFFERQVADNIIEEAGCSVDTRWDRLLGEVYAEDFVALNGIDEWILREIRPPGPAVLEALAADVARPFEPSLVRRRGRLRPRRVASRPVRLTTHAFVTATVSGTRAADLDLFVFRRGSRRPLERGVSRDSRERVRALLEPGSYEVEVYAAAAAGSYRLGVAIE